MLLARAYVASNQHLPGRGKANTNEGKQVDYVTADRHGRGARLADHVANDDHIHHVVNDLQEVGKQQGPGEGDQLFGNVSLCKVLDLCACHGYS